MARKSYRPGQLVTVNGKLFRLTKPNKKHIGLCHKCDLAKEKQIPAGVQCHKYCYRMSFRKTGIRYYLKCIDQTQNVSKMQTATFIVVIVLLVAAVTTHTQLKQLKEEIHDLTTIIGRIYNLTKPQ